MPAPLLLVLDGNSLVHRAYHAAALGQLVDDDGRPVWALKGLVGYAARAAARLRPDAVLIGFDCPERSARRESWAGYKAHRPDKPADLVEQLLAAPGLMRAAGLGVLVPLAYEADDVLASAAATATAAGWRTVVMTSDRDAFALLSDTTSVLRVRNGGMDEAVLVTAATLPDVCGVEAWQYRDYAVLRGDPSDNLPGVRGFGPATAARLLAAFGSLDVALARLAEEETLVRDAVGEAPARHLGSDAMRETIARNRHLMAMRADLPLPALDRLRLPIDLLVMRRALAARGIRLGPSLWALTGGEPPPDDEVVAALRAAEPARSARERRVPGEGQLALF